MCRLCRILLLIIFPILLVAPQGYCESNLPPAVNMNGFTLIPVRAINSLQVTDPV